MLFSVQLACNYIALRCKNQGVYQYAVSFRPEVDSLFMKHKLIENSSHTLGPTHSFDGRILFLPINLEQVGYIVDYAVLKHGFLLSMLTKCSLFKEVCNGDQC